MSDVTELLRGLVEYIKEVHHLSPIKMGRSNSHGSEEEQQQIEYNSCNLLFNEDGLMVTPKIVTNTFSRSSLSHNIRNRITHQYSDPALVSKIEEILLLPGKDSPVNIADLRWIIGKNRYLIMGDPHGCLDEVQRLLDRVKFNRHLDTLIVVGDLIDKGPKSKATVEFFMDLPNFHTVKGNHDHKFYRWLLGNNVKIGEDMQRTINEFSDSAGDMGVFFNLFKTMPFIIRVPAGYVVHAGFSTMPGDARASNMQTTNDCLYTRYIGGGNRFDDINGSYWSAKWDWKNNELRRVGFSEVHKAIRIFHGHEPHNHPEPYASNRCINLDGGCAFGGFLRVWDSATDEVTSIKAKDKYADPGRACWIGGRSD